MSGSGIVAPLARSALLLAAAIAPAIRAGADEASAVDTSRWVCKYCTFEEDASFAPTLGAGYVSDDSAKFGEYTGLNEQGAYAVAGADGRYRGKEGRWFDLSAADLGLSSRTVDAEGGTQGRYELHLNYWQLQHAISDTADTPFIGSGTTSLGLPSSWVPAGVTSAMTALEGSLHGVGLETERRRFDLGGSMTPVQHWSFAVNVRHEQKSGTRGTGGTFVFNDAQLPLPVDYRTDQIDAAAAYHAAGFQARIAYYGSIFDNDDKALLWENPYLPLASGGTTGQLALAPANQFHQLLLATGYQISARTRVTADVAAGRMTQDDAFLPYTVNASLASQPLPRRSLDGRVDTLTGALKLNTTPSDKLRINASLTYNDRNNRTPTTVYEWVSTDTGAAQPRVNLPYSVSRTVASLDGAYALASGIRLYAGCKFDEHERDLQEVVHTRDESCWGKASVSATDFADLSLAWTHAQRTSSGYDPNPDAVALQNPLMRLYNLANRDRDEVKLRIDLAPAERFQIGLDGSAAWDTYYESVIGLRDARSWAAAVDCAWTLSAKLSATCYLSREQLESRQANAEQLAPAPLWFGNSTDTIDTASLGLEYRAHDKLAFGLDCTYARSTGEVAIRSAAVGFPDLTTRLTSARLHADFSPRARLTLRLSYWYEKYLSEDWALDGVTPSTVGNVLAFGQASPNYRVNVIMLSSRYQF
jgi:MtrB/PioB family decaheme-associated outer membrane protein